MRLPVRFPDGRGRRRLLIGRKRHRLWLSRIRKNRVVRTRRWKIRMPGLWQRLTGLGRISVRITTPVSYTHLTLPTTPYV